MPQAQDTAAPSAPELDEKALAIARGDILPDDVNPDDPDGELAAAELEKEIAKDGETKEEAKKDSRIPESRHKAILEKEREKRAELERQLAQYQNGSQIADVNQQITAAEDTVMAMELEYTKLLADGELDKAAQKMSQIRSVERNMAEAKSDMKIHAAEARATERARYNTSLERIEAAFPELNPDHDEYSEELMAEVAELKDAYQIKGFTPTQALQKAVKALVEPRTTRQEMATSSTPRVNDKDIAAERKKDAVLKTERATRSTPPSLSKTGIDSDKLGAGSSEAAAIMKMSQAEFKNFADKNPEALARARGDII